jgi:hypothetical protein
VAAAARGAVRGPRRPARRPSVRDFYRRALTEAEQLELDDARELEGLEEEIAVLRVRLQTALQEKPEDLGLLTKGVEALVKAVGAQYRLSPKARKDLADNVAAVLNSLGDQLLPADR